jgi:hypothetical protein
MTSSLDLQEQNYKKQPLNSLPNLQNAQHVYKNGYIPNLDFNQNETSENIKVCLRIRPLNLTEKGRNDSKSLSVMSETQVVYINKQLRRNYTFNLVFDETASQEDVFYRCSINTLLDSAMEGYSVTIFAYGQTGSGKTYTIMGRDDSINENILTNDTYSGIIAKSVKYIWTSVSNKNSKYYIKASFLEIYNEQINDLLNPSSSASLQVRWDQKQGFFVEGLLVLECKNPEDIVEVLLQGMKNRKKGTHKLNKDSSRSHSILTLYIISEFTNHGETYKKYGKVSFVDLAGSERLKETQSQGGMLKETGNINRSLFVLGKVISSLTEKKNSGTHIPYRDSKLTMLLMDSIGGTSKTLMIACVSPSNAYADETMSTLNYASRTMSIKNKPLVQMEGNARGIISLQEENDYYKHQNEFFKEQLMKLIGSVPDIQSGGFTDEEIEEFRVNSGASKIQKLESEVERIKKEIENSTRAKESQERQNTQLERENVMLNAKLMNLESVFIGDVGVNSSSNSSNNGGNEYDSRNYKMQEVIMENTKLKKEIDKLERDKKELNELIAKKENPGVVIKNEKAEFEELNKEFTRLSKQVEFHQKMERDLLEKIMKLRDYNEVNK